MLSVYQRFAVDDQGRSIRSPEVTVVEAGTSIKAKLFADAQGKIRLKNPAKGDQKGLIRFFTAAGDYDITVQRGLVTRSMRNERIMGSAAISDASRFPFESESAVEQAWIPEDIAAITTLGRLRPGDGGGATLIRARKGEGGTAQILSNGGASAWVWSGVAHVLSVESEIEMYALTALDDGQQVSVRNVGIFRWDQSAELFDKTDIAKSAWETLIAGAVSDFLTGNFGHLRIGSPRSEEVIPADTTVAVEAVSEVKRRDVTKDTGSLSSLTYEYFAGNARMLDIVTDVVDKSAESLPPWPRMKIRFPTSGITGAVGNAVAELSATIFSLSKGIFPKTASYSVAELTSTYPAAKYARAIVYCNNGAAGAPVIAFSNGMHWLRSDNRNEISIS